MDLHSFIFVLLQKTLYDILHGVSIIYNIFISIFLLLADKCWQLSAAYMSIARVLCSSVTLDPVTYTLARKVFHALLMVCSRQTMVALHNKATSLTPCLRAV